MSALYDQYLIQHRKNVKRAYGWFEENLPEILGSINTHAVDIRCNHDFSKNLPDEYSAYDAYFYGGNRSYEVVRDYYRAWLLHLHRNPHHWQHWIRINDDPEEGTIVLEMPYRYIIEMICDWWSFSWAKEKPEEIFAWYDEHSKYMTLHPRTRKTIEHILTKMRQKLDEKTDTVS